MNKFENPFDIKTSPFEYAMFDYIDSKYDIKKVIPFFEYTTSGTNEVTTPNANRLFLGTIKLTQSNSTIRMYALMHDIAGNIINIFASNIVFALNFESLIAIDKMLFSDIALTDIAYYSFIGYKIEF